MPNEEHDPIKDARARESMRRLGTIGSIAILLMIGLNVLNNVTRISTGPGPSAPRAPAPAPILSDTTTDAAWLANASAQWRAGFKASGADGDSIIAYLTRHPFIARSDFAEVMAPAQWLPDSMYVSMVTLRYHSSLEDPCDSAAMRAGQETESSEPAPMWYWYNLGYAFGLWWQDAPPVLQGSPSRADKVAFDRLLEPMLDSVAVQRPDLAGQSLTTNPNLCAATLGVLHLASTAPMTMLNQWSVLKYVRYIDYMSMQKKAEVPTDRPVVERRPFGTAGGLR